MANQRLQYFDVLKGIAIFMVVMGHVITMCIRDIDRTPLFKFISEIHMPLFFFISGWFTCRTNGDGSLKQPDLMRRVNQLLVPMLVVSTLWVFYFPHTGLESPLKSTFSGLWLNEWKNGYWFPIVLMEIFILYRIILPRLGSKHSMSHDVSIIAAVWIGLFLLTYFFQYTDAGQLLSFYLLASYWPAFMTGWLASRYRDGFERLITNGTANTVAIVAGGFLIYYIGWWWEFPGAQYVGNDELHLIVARPLFHICLAIVAVAVFKPAVTVSLQRNPQSRWIRLWSYLGVKSLGIYLLHYFFLFPMGALRPLARDFNLGFAPMLLVATVMSAVIVIVVLGVIRLLSISPILSRLLTGSEK